MTSESHVRQVRARVYFTPSADMSRQVVYSGHRFTLRFRNARDGDQARQASRECEATISFLGSPYLLAGEDGLADFAELRPVVPGAIAHANAVFDLIDRGQVVGCGTVVAREKTCGEMSRGQGAPF